jgi:branched-chain amino acid transport system permease protein
MTVARGGALLAIFVILAAAPYWLPGSYYVNIATQILIYAIFALGLNILLGYGGLVSLGHAGLFGFASYALAVALNAGWDHSAAIVTALVTTVAATAVFAVVSLRATGIGFLMITLALGQILWGLAYRWISVTNGDNGLNISTRPAPFGFPLAQAGAFYYAVLVVFVIVVAVMALFVASPFGASLRGTRDQPRRMNALGYHVFMIRFCACLFSGLLSAVAGILFAYYNQFISPQALALTASAEAVLMVISGGAATLLGPIVGAALVVIMKNVVSAYIVRWNFVLGAIFVVIVIFMPEGLVPGTVRLFGWARAALNGWLAAPAASQEPGR